MCKTFKAIHEIAKKLQKEGKGGNYIKIALPHGKAEGTLYCCMNGHDCHEDVLTLKDTTIECFAKNEVIKEEWLNIPTCHIIAFNFNSQQKM